MQFKPLASCLVGLALVTAGCNNAGDKPDGQQASEGKSTSGENLHHYAGRDWCGEHGIPESECALCNSQVAAAFKEKGDWCAQHDRPESQCFVCHPELKDKFAADYRLKYGEDPPAIQ